MCVFPQGLTGYKGQKGERVGMHACGVTFNILSGFIIVLLGRMIVLIPFDVISYAAGLTRIKFKDYMIATFIGTIPRVIFYVFVGIQFANAIEDSNFALFIGLFTGFVGAIYLFYTFLKKSLNNK